MRFDPLVRSLGLIATDDVKGPVPENGEVLGPVALADAGLVLVHNHAEGPMETILDAPVGSDDAGGFGGWERLAEQVVAILFGSLPSISRTGETFARAVSPASHGPPGGMRCRR